MLLYSICIVIPCYLRRTKTFVKNLKNLLFLTSDRLILEHNSQELFSKLNGMILLG